MIAVEIARDDQDLLVVTENGFGKRTRVDEYPTKGRGTMGVLTIRYTEARGRLAGVDDRPRRLRGDADLAARARSSAPPADGISRMGRPTQGVRLMNLRGDDTVSSDRPGHRAAGRRHCRRRGRGTRHRIAKTVARAPGRPPRSGRHPVPAGPARSLPRAGLRRRRHLEDAARLLDDQGRHRDERPQAAHLRHALGRAGDADQAGQGQGHDAAGSHRGRPRVPGAPPAPSGTESGELSA